MSKNERLGKPVIDGLRVCYVADPLLLDELSHVEVGQRLVYNPFVLIRRIGDRFEFFFSMFLAGTRGLEEVGVLKFGRYGAKANNYCHIEIENHVLYEADLFQEVLSFPDLVGLTFNNFTAIDIAIDYGKSISAIIKRMLRDKTVNTIFNGKCVQNVLGRKQAIPGFSFDYGTSLDRLQCPTVTIRQVKAIKNKFKGTTVQSYDKRAEIETTSGKNYILDYYGRPRYLYRFEVRLNYQEIRGYCAARHIAQDIELLNNPVFLSDIYYYHLSSVLRFTKNRKKLQWPEIIKCNGRV
ncbi:MAG: hypothetical protein IKX71_02490 [Bacteroidales bacterium]|nr:hypothetical protein [Bacteroidales bacterium]